VGRSLTPPPCLFTSRDRDVTSGGIVAGLLLSSSSFILNKFKLLFTFLYLQNILYIQTYFLCICF